MDLKNLGVIIGTKLVMDEAATKVANEAGWKLKSVLRSQRFFTQRDCIDLYRSRILSYIEA